MLKQRDHIALDDFADADRQVAKEWKEVLLEIASHTQDVFIAIECMYLRASQSPRVCFVLLFLPSNRNILWQDVVVVNIYTLP